MNTRTFLGLAAALVATSMPAIGSAQRHRTSNRSVGGYGRGPFYPSRIPRASQNYVGSGVPFRSGGASVTFGPGGGFYGYAPTYYGYNPYGYGYGYGTGYGYGYAAPSYTYGNSYLPGFGYVPRNRYTPGRHLYRHR